MSNLNNMINITPILGSSVNSNIGGTSLLGANNLCNSNLTTIYSSIANTTLSIDVESNKVKHEGETLDLYLKAVIILLNQKGITISEEEIKEAVNSIKIMNKLVE